MKYEEKHLLKNGKEIILRSGKAEDAAEVLNLFNITHSETDNLLTYEDENSFTITDEEEFLRKKYEAENAIELVAIVDGKIVAMGGIEPIGAQDKIKHRAEYGVSILREYWRLGIGELLTNACIECAKKAGYEQLELSVISENKGAVKLYEKKGFVEIGRNPRGFKTREGNYQELITMVMEM